MDRFLAGQQVRQALGAVVEPELGRPITELGFVSAVAVDAGRIHVRLRVPSFFRLVRYGWLVMADARAALGALPWADAVDLCFADAAVTAGGDVSAPGDDTPSELERAEIRRTAFLARHLHLIRSQLDRGVRREDIAALTLADLPATASSAVYLQRRAELRLPTDPGSPVLVTEEGQPVDGDDIDAYLARLRVTVAGD